MYVYVFVGVCLSSTRIRFTGFDNNGNRKMGGSEGGRGEDCLSLHHYFVNAERHTVIEHWNCAEYYLFASCILKKLFSLLKCAKLGSGTTVVESSSSPPPSSSSPPTPPSVRTLCICLDFHGFLYKIFCTGFVSHFQVVLSP